MAYDELLADRIRSSLNCKKISFIEKKMFGGLCFMVNDKMCVGVMSDKYAEGSTLMARIGEEKMKEALHRPGCQPMDFTGRPMKGYVFVQDEGIDMDEDLEYWIQLCLDFNPQAKASKKKK